jgi:hypothetical protein
MEGFVTVDDVPTPTPPTSNINNAIECEYMVYGTFRDSFDAVTVERDYSGMHMFVPLRNGQVVRVTVDVLDKAELDKYREKLARLADGKWY